MKRDLYLRAGVPWLLLIDPDARLAELFERNLFFRAEAMPAMPGL